MDTLVIDTHENDDWMKSLPGYKQELVIHAELAKKHKGKITLSLKPKSGRKQTKKQDNPL